MLNIKYGGLVHVDYKIEWASPAGKYNVVVGQPMYIMKVGGLAHM
jgi:hypothetical protein